jgi:Domain of unknown function (DUF4288)
MGWFIAKIVFNIRMVHTASKFEEQLRLVEADSCEDAFLKAKAIGINEEKLLVENETHFVKWEFVDIAELFPLLSLGNGSEIYSQTLETEGASEYIRKVHQRGMEIRLNA